jgi:hypothetical protein
VVNTEKIRKSEKDIFITSTLSLDFHYKPKLNSHNELSCCRNTRFSCQNTKRCKRSCRSFSPISSYFNFRSSRLLPGRPPIVSGGGQVGNIIRDAGPEGECIIAVKHDGVIAISIPSSYFGNVRLFPTGDYIRCVIRRL